MSDEICEFERFGMDDIDALVELERECFSHPWGAEQFRLGLENKVFHVFGLRRAGVIVAYCSMYIIVDEAEVLNIAVRPELRRQGLGSRLLRIVLQICRKMGIHNARLEVRVSNVAARNLYANFGFEQVGIRTGYYPDTGEDALLMTLDMDKIPERG